MRILIVEDNVDVAATLEALLEMDGYEDVRTAHDATTGLAMAADPVADVVLCDIGLPGAMDGLEFARRARGDARLAGVRLIALSGYGSREDREHALAAGFDELLAKPVRYETLSEALKRGTAR